MAIKYLSRTKAKLIVSTGSASRGNRRQFTRTVTIAGKKDAERQYRAFALECASSSMTAESVGDLVDAYIDMQRIKGIKETTLTGYESYARRLKSAFAGEKAVPKKSHVLYLCRCGRRRATTAKLKIEKSDL